MRPYLIAVGYMALISVSMAGDFFGLKRQSTPEAPALPPAQQPIERIPGFSAPSYTGHYNDQGQHVITQIDRNSDTVKAWIKDGVIDESKIKQIESGKPTPVELPDTH